MITFTDKARERVLAFIEQEESPVALRVTVQAASPLAPQYELSLVDALDEQPEDTVVDVGGFKVYIDEESAAKLEGATVDWVETVHGGGFNVENPNIKPIGSEPPTGELAQRVAQVIEARINPAVAAHGGRVALVDVRDDVVFVELAGGCQGCGMARVTLKQGIERLIKEMIPEVADVIDVTDHSMGRDPYYQASQ
ncbi:MAG: iron-sulfur cluster assembly accessory protein [Gemmatimonadota bacterium]|nr:MAG: iron-sulfur cluster assembly accessory protein [Gemmatimonadota bacterium]